MTRRNCSGGFTLIEMMVVVAIVGILGGIAIPAYLGYLDKARIARCIAEIRSIEKSIQLAYVTTERYPTSLAEVGADRILDPWGAPYQFLNLTAGVPVNGVAQIEGGGSGAWSWIAPSPAYATSSNRGQGNHGGGGDPGSGENHRGGKKNGGGQGPGNAGSSGDPGGNGSGGVQSSGVAPRTDRFGVPLNTEFDLYSMGKDRDSSPPLSTPNSYDDILRANDGAFVGLASDF